MSWWKRLRFWNRWFKKTIKEFRIGPVNKDLEVIYLSKLQEDMTDAKVSSDDVELVLNRNVNNDSYDLFKKMLIEFSIKNQNINDLFTTIALKRTKFLNSKKKLKEAGFLYTTKTRVGSVNNETLTRYLSLELGKSDPRIRLVEEKYVLLFKLSKLINDKYEVVYVDKYIKKSFLLKDFYFDIYHYKIDGKEYKVTDIKEHIEVDNNKAYCIVTFTNKDDENDSFIEEFILIDKEENKDTSLEDIVYLDIEYYALDSNKQMYLDEVLVLKNELLEEKELNFFIIDLVKDHNLLISEFNKKQRKALEAIGIDTSMFSKPDAKKIKDYFIYMGTYLNDIVVNRKKLEALLYLYRFEFDRNSSFSFYLNGRRITIYNMHYSVIYGKGYKTYINCCSTYNMLISFDFKSSDKIFGCYEHVFLKYGKFSTLGLYFAELFYVDRKYTLISDKVYNELNKIVYHRANNVSLYALSNKKHSYYYSGVPIPIEYFEYVELKEYLNMFYSYLFYFLDIKYVDKLSLFETDIIRYVGYVATLVAMATGNIWAITFTIAITAVVNSSFFGSLLKSLGFSNKDIDYIRAVINIAVAVYVGSISTNSVNYLTYVNASIKMLVSSYNIEFKYKELELKEKYEDIEKDIELFNDELEEYNANKFSEVFLYDPYEKIDTSIESVFTNPYDMIDVMIENIFEPKGDIYEF